MQIESTRYSQFCLWQTKIDSDTVSTESAVQLLFGRSEKRQLNGITHAKRRREYLLSRALIRSALSELFERPTDFWILEEIEVGAPLVTNLPKPIFYSLSHSHGHLAFVSAEVPIGVDLEKIKAKSNLHALAKHFMTDTELSQLKQAKLDTIDYFFRCWSTKEAYYKSLPRDLQIQFDPRAIEIDSLEKLTPGRHSNELSDGDFSRIVVCGSLV